MTYPYPYGQPPSGYPYPGYPTPGGYHPPPPPYAALGVPPVKSFYYIRSRLNGLVFDIEGANRSPGARVVMWSQKGTSDGDNQLWYDDFTTGTIRSKLNDFCLDIDGDTIVVRPFYPNNTNQQWERVEPYIRNRYSPNKVIDIAGGNRKPSARLIIHDAHGGLNQCFDYQFLCVEPEKRKLPPPVPSPKRQRFYIVSEMNCKVLDIRGDSPVSGAQVIMWPKKPGHCANQLWYFDEQGVIRSALNNFALEARVSGANATMMPFTGDPHQCWKYVGNRIMKNQHECLDIRGESKKDGAEVISYQYKGSANQHWRLEYV